MKKKIAIQNKGLKAPILKKKILKKKGKLEETKISPENQEPNPLDEEINSDFLDDQEEPLSKKKETQFNLSEDEEDEKVMENVDEKRLKIAKRILQDTKAQYEQHQQEKYENEGFNRGVELNDDEKKINEALQNQILNKKNLIYSDIAEKIQQPPKNIGYFKGHTKCITAVQFDPFNKNLYSTSKDSSIISWDIETKKRTFISLGKEKNAHKDDILCASLNFDGKILATSGMDKTIKLWDTNSKQLITTMTGHRKPVYGIKFGLNSNNLASISCDKTLKLWDATAQSFVDTFFGHSGDAIDIDAVSEDAFLSSGYDRQAILWKTKYGSQLIFHGHDASIDCVRSLTPDFFVTGSQDSSISLWHLGKKKPIWSKPEAHGKGKWITALGTTHNTDLVVSGSYNNKLNFYKLNQQNKCLEDIFQIDSNGIITNLSFSSNCQYLASVESDEHRLGRWITSKAKNKIIIHQLW